MNPWVPVVLNYYVCFMVKVFLTWLVHTHSSCFLCFLTCSHLSLNTLFSDTEYIPDLKSRVSSLFSEEEYLEIKIQHYLCIFLVFSVFRIRKYCVQHVHTSVSMHTYVYLCIKLYRYSYIDMHKCEVHAGNSNSN